MLTFMVQIPACLVSARSRAWKGLAPALLFAAVSAFSPNALAEDPNALFQQALAEQKAGHFEDAVRDYRKLLAAYPDTEEVRINLGAALAGLNRFDEAAQEYRKVLAADPLNDGVRLNLGLAFYKRQDFQSAISPLRELQRRHPDDQRAAVLLSDCLRRTGQIEQIPPLLTRFADQTPPNYDLLYLLGVAMTHTGDKRKGLDYLEQAGRGGSSADALQMAGATALDLSQLDRARSDLDQALQLNPQLPGIQTLAGEAREKTGDTEGAKNLLRQALERNSRDFDASLRLGAILYKERNLEAAHKYLATALDLNASSAMARYEFGLLQIAEGATEDGIKNLEIASRVDPHWLEPHIQLAALYYKVHRPEDGARERATVDHLRQEQGTRKAP